jgi:hypothetical protein
MDLKLRFGAMLHGTEVISVLSLVFVIFSPKQRYFSCHVANAVPHAIPNTDDLLLDQGTTAVD